MGSKVIFGIDIASMVLGGLAAGMVLFIVSVGLSVTMGLMGFVNLAHGGFAMLGGYVIAGVMKPWGIGFVPARVGGGGEGVVGPPLSRAALPGARARPVALPHRPRVHDDRVGPAPGRAREPAA